MYAQYFLVQNRKGKWPILMWHGGGLTGATYETTPDGREGWRDMMIRKGWDVYITDATERGRSGFASPLIWKDDPVFLTETDPWDRFRIGPGPGSFSRPAKRKLLPGNQFPIEAYDNFLKQIVPRWLSTDKAIIDAYVALIDKVCPCVILAHSQGGHFAFRAAEQRPDKVKALVSVEPATSGGVDGAKLVKDVPLLLVYGDYIEQDPRWVAYRKAALAYADAMRAAGGSVDVIEPAGARHQGQLAHADDGQEQPGGAGGHLQMARRTKGWRRTENDARALSQRHVAVRAEGAGVPGREGPAHGRAVISCCATASTSRTGTASSTPARSCRL